MKFWITITAPSILLICVAAYCANEECVASKELINTQDAGKIVEAAIIGDRTVPETDFIARYTIAITTKQDTYYIRSPQQHFIKGTTCELRQYKITLNNEKIQIHQYLHIEDYGEFKLGVTDA